MPFAPFRVGGELGVSPLLGAFAVRQEFPLSSVVFAQLLFVCGVPLNWPARIAGTDLVLRRRAEALLLELPNALADECNRLADEREAAKAS